MIMIMCFMLDEFNFSTYFDVVDEDEDDNDVYNYNDYNDNENDADD